MSNLDSNWIAVAHVYATLAVAAASKSAGLTFTQDKEKYLAEAATHECMAKSALIAAGVEG